MAQYVFNPILYLGCAKIAENILFLPRVVVPEKRPLFLYLFFNASCKTYFMKEIDNDTATATVPNTCTRFFPPFFLASLGQTFYDYRSSYRRTHDYSPFVLLHNLRVDSSASPVVVVVVVFVILFLTHII